MVNPVEIIILLVLIVYKREERKDESTNISAYPKASGLSVPVFALF